MASLPGGPARAAAIRTFLIADIRGYTRFTAQHGDEAASRLATRFADVATEGVEAWGGELVELRGDEALAVFELSPPGAPRGGRAPVGVRRRDRGGPGPAAGVGIGLDAGEAVPVGDGYRGAALNIAARLCAIAAAGRRPRERGPDAPGRPCRRARVHDARADRRSRAMTSRRRGAVSALGRTAAAAERGAPGPRCAPYLRPTTRARPARAARSAASPSCAGCAGTGDAPRHGHGRTVVLSGPPGIGKTRLAAELATTVHADGATVVYLPATREPDDRGLRGAHRAGRHGSRHRRRHRRGGDARCRRGRTPRPTASGSSAAAARHPPPRGSATAHCPGRAARAAASSADQLGPLEPGRCARHRRALCRPRRRGRSARPISLARSGGVPAARPPGREPVGAGRCLAAARGFRRPDRSGPPRAARGRGGTDRGRRGSRARPGARAAVRGRPDQRGRPRSPGRTRLPVQGPRRVRGRRRRLLLRTREADRRAHRPLRRQHVPRPRRRLGQRQVLGAPGRAAASPRGRRPARQRRPGPRLSCAQASTRSPSSAERSRGPAETGRCRPTIPPAALDAVLATLAPGGRLVVVVDQFEEVFNATRDDAERSAFIDLLTGERRGLKVIVVDARRSLRPLCGAIPRWPGCWAPTRSSSGR